MPHNDDKRIGSYKTEISEGSEVAMHRCLAEAGCNWAGDMEQLLNHVERNHLHKRHFHGEKEMTIRIPNLDRDYHTVELVVAYGHLFWLHVSNQVAAGILYAVCQHLGGPRAASEPVHFMFRSEFCDRERLACSSVSTETTPDGEDIKTIVDSGKCTLRAIDAMRSFADIDDNSLSFSGKINQAIYYE